MLLIVVVLVLIVGGFFAWRYFESYESTDDAQIDGHLMPLSARISGYVSSVNVNDNQYVTAGTVLVEIDPKDYQVALEKAQADLADAQATAQSQNINVPITSINTTQPGLLVRSWSGRRASRNLGSPAAIGRRASPAYAGRGARRESPNGCRPLQTARGQTGSLAADVRPGRRHREIQRGGRCGLKSAVSAARGSRSARPARNFSQLRRTCARRKPAPSRLLPHEQRLSPHEANVESTRRADVEQAETNLQYTKIIAPVNGIVMKNVEVGMNVAPGQQLLTIIPLDDIWVTANFKETQLKNMRPGQSVEYLRGC